MTQTDIEILVKYLQKTVVPQADQAAFIKAFERLIALQKRVPVAA
jgi:hypothetical protein